MRAVRGIYDDGVVSLLDTVPLRRRQEVTVFIPEDDEERAPQALEFAGMLSDLTLEESAAFDAAIARGLQFARQVQS